MARAQATLAGGRLTASALLRGARLGEMSAELTAPLARTDDGDGAPLLDTQAAWQGHAQARIADLSWVGALLGAGWQVGGRLNGEMRLSGSASRPQFDGEWQGEELALRNLDQGLRLERGQAQLEITPQRLLLRRLTMESDFQPLPPTQAKAPELDAARLSGTPGHFAASGELTLGEAAAGSTRLGFHLDRIGVLQGADRWLALSGDGELKIDRRVLDVVGKLRVDGGYFALAENDRPRLSDDVVIHRGQLEKGKRYDGAPLHIDLEAELGRHAYFHGLGIDSRVTGTVHLRSNDAGVPRASGSIETVDGRFDAYGQKLAIQRGILNFQGPIDNPGLNIRAVRTNLPVEAGVEVTGTVQRPVVQLVSTPPVPDTEKLSWLVLGRSPEQGGNDNSILLAAAQTLMGGQGGGVLQSLQKGLGIDEVGVTTGQIGGYGNLPTSQVASSSGFGRGGQTVNGQIVSVGKRLSADAVLSYQQSLNTAESIVKLTYALSRQFSLIGRAGSDNAVDLMWHRSFGK